MKSPMTGALHRFLAHALPCRLDGNGQGSYYYHLNLIELFHIA